MRKDDSFTFANYIKNSQLFLFWLWTGFLLFSSQHVININHLLKRNRSLLYIKLVLDDEVYLVECDAIGLAFSKKGEQGFFSASF